MTAATKPGRYTRDGILAYLDRLAARRQAISAPPTLRVVNETEPAFSRIDDYASMHAGRVTEADHAREEMRLLLTHQSDQVPPGLVCSGRLP